MIVVPVRLVIMVLVSNQVNVLQEHSQIFSDAKQEPQHVT